MRSNYLKGMYILATGVIFLLLGACMQTDVVDSSGQSTQDALFTAAVETIQTGYQQSTESAAGTQAALPASPTSTPVPSPTPIPPTSTPTPAPTNTPQPTPTQPAPQPSPSPQVIVPQGTATQPAAATPGAPGSLPVVSATINTNCRTGPGSEFEIVGRLNVGQQMPVHGRDRFDQWWFIQHPSQPGQFCWVWSGSTQVTGDVNQLPVVTPTPAATPTTTPGSTLNVSFAAVRVCDGMPTAIFQVDNAGGQRLDSLNLQIDDLTGGRRLFGPSASDAPFMGSTGECPPGGDILDAGRVGYIGGALGSQAPSGNTARASIRLCTQNGLAGTCTDRSVEFTIP